MWLHLGVPIIVHRPYKSINNFRTKQKIKNLRQSFLDQGGFHHEPAVRLHSQLPQSASRRHWHDKATGNLPCPLTSPQALAGSPFASDEPMVTQQDDKSHPPLLQVAAVCGKSRHPTQYCCTTIPFKQLSKYHQCKPTSTLW